MTATPPTPVEAVARQVGMDGKPRRVEPRSELVNEKLNPAQRRQRAAERRVRITAQIIAKRTYREIAAQEGVSLACIADDVKVIRAGWAERAGQLYDTVRAEEIAKLDAMERGIAARAMLGEESAITVMLRIGERRAKLMGLDAPARVDALVVTQHVGPTAAEVLAAMTEEERDRRTAEVGAVLADIGVIEVAGVERESGDESGAGRPVDAEADPLHPPGANGETGGVSAA